MVNLNQYRLRQCYYRFLCLSEKYETSRIFLRCRPTAKFLRINNTVAADYLTQV